MARPSKHEVERQLDALMFGSEFGDEKLAAAMRAELRERLAEGRPLRVYAGYDPSRPDLHIGHAITLRKLRMFQDFGHEVIFLVGTFTATVGDASDKAAGRPRRSAEEVSEAARSYAEQCYRILDRTKTSVVYNADWLSRLPLAEFVAIASNFTVQQFTARDNFRLRIQNGDPIGLHELFYALLQGWDAVHLRADVQLGATEQLFNIQAGRKLQEIHGQRPCVILTYPILVGTDGKARMSKSAGNYVGIADLPDDQYGKVMSVSDETMVQWLRLTTRWSPDEVEREIADLQAGRLGPMELKKKLAAEIVATYHGEAAAQTAAEHFASVHQRREIPDEMPEVRAAAGEKLIDVLVRAGAAASKSAARRLVQGSGVRFAGETVGGIDAEIAMSGVLQVGKRHFYRVVLER
jgi:tyrosyl-tRNA synthetase